MLEQTIASLEQLATDDPEVARVALMYRDAILAFDDPLWDITRLTLHHASPEQAHPALHNQSIGIDPDRVRDLMRTMASSGKLAELAPGLDRFIDTQDMIRFLQVMIEWDVDEFQRIGEAQDIEPAALLALGNTVLMPQFHRIAEILADSVDVESNDIGFCPVCGSWPGMAEQRGLAKQLWLRCVRCGTGWKSRHQKCVFCDNTDHKTLGYLAAEGERESRRINTCNECDCYIKVFATVTPLTHADVLRVDLESFVLDVGAVDAGYHQPAQPGFPIEVAVQPASELADRF